MKQCQSQLATAKKSWMQEWNQPEREKCAQLEGQSHLNPLTSDMELWDSVFALVGFSFALVLTMPFLPLGTAYILCHYMLEICNLLFHFTGVTIKKFPCVSEEKVVTV